MAEAEDPPTLLSLPDELLLEILRSIDELAHWVDVSLACRRLFALVCSNRTVLSAALPYSESLFGGLQIQGPLSEESLSRCHRKFNAFLAAAERTEQNLQQLQVHGFHASQGTADYQQRLAKVVVENGSSLTTLELRGPFQYTAHTCALDSLVCGLAAAEPACALRRLDLSWNSSCDNRALASLIHASAGLLELRLDGHSRVDDLLLRESIAPLMPQLTELSLSKCSELSAGAVANVIATSASTSLASLDLSFLRLSLRAVREIFGSAGLRRGLRSLSLAGFTGLSSDAFKEVLCSCEGLTSIDFSASLVSDDALRHAAVVAPLHLAKLRNVHLSECSAVTDDGMSELCNAAGNALRSLAVGGPFSPLGNATAQTIGKRCAAPLRKLEMSSCRNLGVSGLAALAPICGMIEHLDLSDSPTLTSEALGQILRRSGPGCGARLRVLMLRSCDVAVTDELLADFLPRAHALRTLDLAFCTSLTDLTAMCIATARARALRNLRHLDLNGCNRFSSARGQPTLLRACRATGATAAMRLVHSFEGDEEVYECCASPVEVAAEGAQAPAPQGRSRDARVRDAERVSLRLSELAVN